MASVASRVESRRTAWFILFAMIVVIIALPFIATHIWGPPHSIVDISWLLLWQFTVATMPLTFLGALIASRQPENRIGWLMLGIGVVCVVSFIGLAWGDFARAVSAPGAGWGTFLGEWIVLYPIIALVTLAPLLFPDGKLPGPRWRAVVALTIVAAIVWPPVENLSPENLSDSHYPQAVRVEWIARDLHTFAWVTGLLLVAAVFCSLAGMVVRARRSHGIERQQIKWFLYVAALNCVLFVLSGLPFDLASSIAFAGAMILTIIGLPIAITVAVLRYRLFEIDRIISRSISWLLVTAVLGALYLLVVVVLGEAFQSVTGGGSQLHGCRIDASRCRPLPPRPRARPVRRSPLQPPALRRRAHGRSLPRAPARRGRPFERHRRGTPRG